MNESAPRARAYGASPVKQGKPVSRRGSLYASATVETDGASAELTAWADGRIDIEVRAPGADRFGSRVIIGTLYPAGSVVAPGPTHDIDRPTLYLNAQGTSDVANLIIERDEEGS